MKITKAVLVMVMFFAAVGTLRAATLVIGNNGANGANPIETFDFDAGGTKIGTFAPDHNARARGLAVGGNEVFYTELTDGQVWDPVEGYVVVTLSPAIHVAPFNGGAGGAETRTIPNPAPGNGIAGLTFFQGYLYAMTGYTEPEEYSAGLQVWKLNPYNGAILGGPINIIDHHGTFLELYADGFAVLPNGNFLINRYDASTNYEEFNSVTGVRTGFSFNVPNAQYSTGVDTDGTHLYFAADDDGHAGAGAAHIVKTDMAGNFVADVPQLNGYHALEDISLEHSIVPPISTSRLVPAGMTNVGFGFWFTNSPGYDFTVFGTTNVTVPITNWSVLGSATEISPGRFEFIDSQATNMQQRFYRVGWP